jgi:excisionase family DNA binding protein
MDLPRLLTPQQIAECLQVDDTLVYRMLRDREMPGIKIGKRGQWRVRLDRFEAWLDEQERRVG